MTSPSTAGGVAAQDIHQPQNPTDPATGLRVGTFAVGTFAREAEPGGSFPALVHPHGAVVDLSDHFRDLHAVFADWQQSFAVLGDIAANGRTPSLRIEELRALPPLDHPQLLCAGANNRTHVAQMFVRNAVHQQHRRAGESDEDFFERIYASMDARSSEGTPFFWTSLHSALVGAADDVVLPLLGEQPDWELELGVVVGQTGRYVTPDEAQGMIAGYTVVNDIGTVDLFRRTDVAFGYDWIGKHQPTFKPAGPFIVPAAFVSPSEDMRISLRLNGEPKQDWPANDWIFSPAQYLTYASERVRLLPGDIVCMGSPPGNGAHHGGRFLEPGDVIESEITYLGRQRNRCVAEDAGGRSPYFGHWANA